MYYEKRTALMITVQCRFEKKYFLNNGETGKDSEITSPDSNDSKFTSLSSSVIKAKFP